MTTPPPKDKDAAPPPDAKAEEAKPEPAPVLTVEDGELARDYAVYGADIVSTEILSNIALIGRAVATIEPRLTTRVLRTLTTLRKKLTRKALKDAIDRAFPKGCE